VVDKEKLTLWFKSNVNQIFIFGMVALLAIRGLILMTEGGLSAPVLPQIKSVPLEPVLTVDSELYQRVHHLISRRVDFEQSDYWVLAELNMFDPKLAQSHEQLAQQANQIFEQASRTYNQAMSQIRGGNRQRGEQLLNDALRQVSSTLDRQPNHARALAMRRDILAQLEGLRQLQAAPEGAATPGTP
jgi:hypothetical protein